MAAEPNSEVASEDRSGATADTVRSAPESEIERLRAADEIASLDAQGLADLIGLLTQASRDEEASAYAERLLVLRPAHRRALRVLTRWPRPGVDVAAGWRAFAATTPKDPEPWLQIARMASRAKNANETIEACDEILARAPDHVEALSIKLGELQLAGRHEESCELWTKLRGLDPKRSHGLLLRAAEGPDTDAAVTLLGAAAALGALDSDLARLRAGLRIKLAAGAYEAEAANEHEVAARAFWRLKQLDAGETEYADGLQRAILRLRAIVERAGREPGPAAMSSARAVMRLDPGFLAAHVVSARALALSERWDEAAEAFARALALDADDRFLRLEHAVAAARSGNMSAAIASWRLARPAGDEAPEQSQDRAARDQLQRSARMNFNRAVERGDWAAAWAAHHSLVELNDDPAVAAARRSGLLKDTEKAVREAANERSPETAELCRLFLDAEPGDPRMTLILGRALLRERRYEEALPIWRYLRDASPDDVEPALQLARLAKRLDDWTLGAQESARLLAMAPDHEEGAALKRHFDENTAAG